MCVQFFSETTFNSNDSGHLLFFIFVSPREGGTLSRDLTTILAPECRAFSGALKIETLKAPPIPGPEGAEETNDWCITHIPACIRNYIDDYILCS